MSQLKLKIKKIIFKIFSKDFRTFIEQELLSNHKYYKFLNISFSQEGEDQILSQFFYGIDKGYFLDIGAYHPIIYSNTYKFYLNGWRGINIDAMPGSMINFNNTRPEDINLEVGVSEEHNELDYYIFKSAGLNTFSKTFANEMQKRGYELINTIKVETVKMKDILNKYIPEGKEIHFLSLDVEGLELEVLRSNDWSTFRPRIILVESLGLYNKDILGTYMNQNDYTLVAQTINNLYYADSQTNINLFV